jgi:hypothetical protein
MLSLLKNIELKNEQLLNKTNLTFERRDEAFVNLKMWE